MYNVYLNSESLPQDFKSFESKMLEICNEHRKEDRALAFAFILYDFENPHLRKILEDRYYWEALNIISGKYLTVFSIHCKREEQIERELKKPMHFMNQFTTFESLFESSNQLINRY